MLSTESRRGRRIVARLDRGTDLFDGIRSLCQKYRVRSGELRGIGALEQAELAAFDQTQRRWKPARTVAGGGLELLHLAGNVSEEDGTISIQCQATLMRDRDTGVEMIGGHLRRAVVYSVELVVESFDDLVLRRQVDASTGLSRWQEVLNDEPAPTPEITTPIAPPTGIASTILSPTAPPPKPTPTSTPAPTWSAVAAVSGARREEPNDEEIILNAGDVILHPRFQRCVVHRIEGHGEFVQVMLKNGRVVRLSTEVMRLTPQGVENGQRVFAATIL